jgi:uncharacterized RDD family membrane protein YckC
MKKLLFKRVIAYVIDSILIVFILTLFSKLPIFNIDTDKYYEVYNEYIDTVSKAFETGEPITTEIINEYSYTLAKYSMNSTIGKLVLSAFYFIVFQFLNKGQTIGKKLMKIKVVNSKDKNPTFIQILLHAGIGYGIFINIITVLLFFLASKSLYLNVITYVQLLDIGIIFTTIIMLLFRKDKRALHNLIAGTKIVSEVEI